MSQNLSPTPSSDKLLVIPGTLSKYNSTESLKSSPLLSSVKFGSMESLKTPAGLLAARSFRIQGQTSYDSFESNTITPSKSNLNLNYAISESEKKRDVFKRFCSK